MVCWRLSGSFVGILVVSLLVSQWVVCWHLSGVSVGISVGCLLVSLLVSQWVVCRHLGGYLRWRLSDAFADMIVCLSLLVEFMTFLYIWSGLLYECMSV